MTSTLEVLAILIKHALAAKNYDSALRYIGQAGNELNRLIEEIKEEQ
jgi:hypothetical protein